MKHLCYNSGMAETKPKYTLLSTDENGNEVRQYENGYIRNQNGQIIVLPENAPVITSENARQYHQMRKQKILDAIEREITDLTRTNAPADAIAKIVRKRAEIALKDKGKSGNDAAKIVLSAVDAYQNKAAEGSTNVLRHEYVMDDSTRDLLERMLRDRRDTSTNVLDATASESESEK